MREMKKEGFNQEVAKMGKEMNRKKEEMIKRFKVLCQIVGMIS